jgi:glycosyltransferase involved in cell wall biosynthesis
MRLVFVNYMHPGVAHVSGMRMHYFADALTMRGHQVVLLTRTLDEVGVTGTPDQVVNGLERHDWSEPFHLACVPQRRWSLERVRDTRTPRPIRQAFIAWHYLVDEGMFSDWTAGSRSYWKVLGEHFRPQATWGTFGNVDSWVIARGIARQAGAPWVMDVKDGWENFIPAPFRNLLARRFQDAAGLTANSVYLAEQYARWFPHRAEVIYSGVDEGWLQNSFKAVDDFRVVLVGSVYGERNLSRFMQGFRSWLEQLRSSTRGRVSLCYAGGSAREVEQAVIGLRELCPIEVHGYLPLPELATLCRSAAVNTYLWSAKTFHHKLVELLCCQRPIISFPGERQESIELAKKAGGSLTVCRDEGELQSALEQVRQGGLQPNNAQERLRELTWKAQADRLEAVLKQAVKAKR